MDSVSTQIAGSIRFQDWRGPIQMASDIDALVRLAKSYYCTWTPEQLDKLPWVVTSAPPISSEAIVSCAVLASREELKFDGAPEQHNLLREMALTMAAAATRLRFLRSFGNRV